MKTATSRYILLQHAPLLTGIHFSVELETMRKMTSCRLVILWTLMTTEVKNKKLHNWAYNKLFYIMNVPCSNGNFNIMVNERFPFRPPNWFFTVDSCFPSSEPNILVKLVLPQSKTIDCGITNILYLLNGSRVGGTTEGSNCGTDVAI